MEALPELLQAKLQPDVTELEALGIKVGKLYTDKGFPPDMALDRLEDYTQLQKLSIIEGICEWLIEHKRNSGATDKAIDRQRKTNKQMVVSFLRTGELGIY